MHIKTIVVDGFKSYATRTEISGFDPEFNAITGLNGSGKSNILDAICFVLGISNLTQVRHPSCHRERAGHTRALARLGGRRVRCPVVAREARVIVRSSWQVRAASLNELIYKQGQAGVTKASVTLVFDNTDPAMSPHGYDQYSQLTVTRQVCCRPPAPAAGVLAAKQ